MSKTSNQSGSKPGAPSRTKKITRKPSGPAVAGERKYDVDAWEPSLLERMLKANGRSCKNT